MTNFSRCCLFFARSIRSSALPGQMDVCAVKLLGTALASGLPVKQIVRPCGSFARKLVTVVMAVSSFILLEGQPSAQTTVAPAVGQSDGFDSISYSDNGQWIASGAGDGTAAIWDLKSGRIIRRFNGDTKSVETVSISPDRKSIASISSSIRIWEISSGNLLNEFDKVATNHMAMSPDWRSIAGDGIVYQGGKSSKVIKVADSSNGSNTNTLFGHADGSLNKIIYSRDGRFIASASDDKTGRLWDAKTGKLLQTYGGHQGAVTSIAFSPDAQRVVTGSEDKSIRIWRTSDGKLEKAISGSADKIAAVGFGSDRRLLAAASDRALRVFDSNTWELVWKTESDDGINDLKFSPDGRRIAIATYQNIIILDVTNGNIIQKLGRAVEAAIPVAFGTDGSSLIADGKVLRFWNIAAGRLVNQSEKETNLSSILAVSPDRRSVATSSYEGIAVWDSTTGKLRRSLQKPPEYISSLVYSPDGRSFVSGGGKTVRIWDLASGRSARTFGVSSQYSIKSVAVSPDGTAVAVSTLDALRLFESGSGRLIRTFERRQGDAYYAMAFGNNGRWLVTGGFVTCSPLAGCHGSDRIQWGAIKVWDVASGRLLRTMDDYKDRVEAIAVSQDAQTVVGVANDNTIKVWNTNNGRLLKSLGGNATTVKSVDFSPDGKRIAGGSESEIKIWDTASGEVLVSLVCSEQGEWAAITPEGFFDASANGAALLYVIDGFRTEAIDQAYNALYRPDLVREKLAGDPDGKVKAAAARLDLNKVMASGSAPKAVIASPAAGASSATDEVMIEATISDQGGGIGKVEWRVNGVTSGIETRGLERVEAAASTGRSLTVKRTLALERGENRIEVLAYNNKDLIASEPASVTVKWDGEKTAAPPKLYVMAVGVNDYYDSRLRLSYAVPDATAIAEGFRKAGNGLYAAVDVTTVLDKDVTIANLDKVFTELGKKAQPRDVFVFFLAGHGKTKNGRYYFLPRDFRYEDEDSIEKAGMDQDKFQAWFAKIAARKSILLYDTCESGSLTGTKARGSDIDERLGALNRMTRATGRTFLTATTDDAPALEGYRGHGVFTYALLDALEHADVNKNGLIEVSELADYIDQKVPDFSFEAFKLRQIPQRNIVGNNFALTNKMVVFAADGVNPANISIPSKPTHVVIAPADVFMVASTGGTVIEKLEAGAQVTLVETVQGWIAIARNGKKIGFVKEQALLRLQ